MSRELWYGRARGPEAGVMVRRDGRHHRRVVTVVFYGPGIHDAPTELDGGAFAFRVQTIFLGEQSGKAVLQRLQDIMRRGDALTPTDRVDLILLPLMAHSRPLAEVLRDAVHLAPALPEAERTATLGALVGIAYDRLSEEIARSLLEDPEMSTVFEELVQRGYVKL